MGRATKDVGERKRSGKGLAQGKRMGKEEIKKQKNVAGPQKGGVRTRAAGRSAIS